jgi:hypothetical protein
VRRSSSTTRLSIAERRAFASDDPGSKRVSRTGTSACVDGQRERKREAADVVERDCGHENSIRRGIIDP